MKSGRQGTILRIISEQSIETQNQLMDELKKRGIDTTQGYALGATSASSVSSSSAARTAPAGTPRRRSRPRRR